MTGRSGAGKTSLLQVVARSMQEDSRTFACKHFTFRQRWTFKLHSADTYYVDLAKYSGSPIPKLRLLLNYWMGKAAWHRPCVLVMDNIDKLMSAEVEVCRFILCFFLHIIEGLPIACRLIPQSTHHRTLSHRVRAFGSLGCP